LTGSLSETPGASAAVPPVAAAASPTPDASSARMTPVVLSRAQTTAMEDALWRALEDPAWVKLGPHSAGVGRDGVTVVCGSVKTRNSFGVYSQMTPFRGEFRGKEFKPAAVGS